MLDPRYVIRLRVRSGAPPSPTGVAGPVPPAGPAQCFERCQAEALCDLLADPRSGISAVRLVSARPGLRHAVQQAAARRGLPEGLEREPEREWEEVW